MLKKIALYLLALLGIFATTQLFKLIFNVTIGLRITPIHHGYPYPISVLGAIIFAYLDVIWGILIGCIYLVSVRMKRPHLPWRFNGYLFFIVVLPLLIYPFPIVFYQLGLPIPLISFFESIVFFSSDWNFFTSVNILAGFLLAFCFYKEKENA